MSENTKLATDLADALWACMEARTELHNAKEGTTAEDSFDYFASHLYDAVERADTQLAGVLARLTEQADG